MDSGMKAKAVSFVCLVAICLASVQPCRADDDKGAGMIVDVLIARPAGLAATLIGSAFFVVVLPFAAMSKSVDKAAEHLVMKPAKMTFTRPIGDFDDLRE